MARQLPEPVRLAVARRARYRCEYCLIHEDDCGFRHEVDHIISRKHGGASAIDNLSYACVLCNRFKGSDVASVDSETGEPVALFNPRRHEWATHFEWNGVMIAGLTAIGHATIRVLRLNAPERLLERKALGAGLTPT